MAYAEKRDGKLTGRWIARARTKKGSFQRSFDSKKEAEGYELYVKLTGEEPPAITSGNTGRTFAEVAKECREAGGPRGVWKSGKDKSLSQRLDYVIDRIGAVDIGDVTRKVVREKIVEDLQKRPRPGKDASKRLTTATINRYVTAVSAVLSWAADEEIIEHKPKLPFVKEHNERQGVLSFAQENEIVETMRADGHKIAAVCVRFLVDTGLRVGEMYKLAPEQISNDHVHLRGDQTKNHIPRQVYVDPDLAREMRAIIAAGALPKYFHLLEVFKAAVKKCGHPDNIVLHSLRHTRNTRLRKEGVDIKIRMKMLGHKSPVTNLRYDHVDDADQLEAAKKVEARRGQAAQSGAIVAFEAKENVEKSTSGAG